MNEILETYIKKEIFLRPKLIEDDLKYLNKTFNHKLEYYNIIEYINDFLEGKNINR